jgi:hypothetical protein
VGSRLPTGLGAALFTVAALAAVTLSGCFLNPSSTSKVAQNTGRGARILKVTNNTFKYVVVPNLPDGSLRRLGEELTAAVDARQSLKPTLDRIAASDDPYGEAIASAVCTGLGQVAQVDESSQNQPTSTSWDRFLIAQVRALLPGNPIDAADAAVRRFTNTANLAEINPRVAQFYFQECARR